MAAPSIRLHPFQASNMFRLIAFLFYEIGIVIEQVSHILTETLREVCVIYENGILINRTKYCHSNVSNVWSIS